MFSLHSAELARSLLKDSILTDLKVPVGYRITTGLQLQDALKYLFRALMVYVILTVSSLIP